MLKEEEEGDKEDNFWKSRKDLEISMTKLSLKMDFSSIPRKLFQKSKTWSS